MAILKTKDIKKMNPKEREDKIKELKFELIRAGIAANKGNAKTKEIKRTISRLITINKPLNEEELKNKK